MNLKRKVVQLASGVLNRPHAFEMIEMLEQLKLYVKVVNQERFNFWSREILAREIRLREAVVQLEFVALQIIYGETSIPDLAESGLPPRAVRAIRTAGCEKFGDITWDRLISIKGCGVSATLDIIHWATDVMRGMQ